MADPITASVEIALAAVKTGVAVAQWWTDRESRRRQNVNSTEPSFGGFYRQSPEDLLYVVATIGQWMFALEVVNVAALPAARVATSQAFQAGDPDDNDLGHVFDHMEQLVQNAVACGMVFCAECWPMHMWKGFGCGVFNELRWADPNHSNVYCLELDNSISALKSQPHQWQVLKRSPSAVGKMDPETLPRDKSVVKKNMSMAKDILQQFEKVGFPQPTAPYNDIKITSWWIPFATWNGNSMYENEFHRPDAVVKYQADPGRFLWAWTAGKQAKLNPGEGLLLLDDHIGYLAQWLGGLKGIPFKMLLDTQVDFSKIRYSRTTRAYLKNMVGNEHGINGTPLVIVHDPNFKQDQDFSQHLAGSFGNLAVTAPANQMPPVSPPEPIANINQPVSPVSPGVAFPSNKLPRRRPVPQPPVAALKSVVATHAFSAESAEELTLAAGDIIEILDDKFDDGWWKARLGGRTGFIPNTYVKELDTDTAVQEKRTPVSIPITNMDPQSLTPPTTPLASMESKNSNPPPYNMNEALSFRSQGLHYHSPSETRLPTQTDLSTKYNDGVLEAAIDAQKLPRQQLPSSYVEEQNLYSATRQPTQSVDTSLPEDMSHWNLGAAKQDISHPTVLNTLYGHSKAVTVAAISPDDGTIASGSKDKTIRLWDVTSGKFQQTLSGHTSGVEDTCFASDNRILASGAFDQTVRLWDVRSHAGIHTLKTSAAILSIAISPDTRILAVGMLNDKIELWDSRTLTVLHTLKGHKSLIQAVAFAPSLQLPSLSPSSPSAVSDRQQLLLASGSNDKTIRTWDPVIAQPLQTIKAHSGMMNYVLDVSFSSDANHIASASSDGTVKLWQRQNTTTSNPEYVFDKTLKCGMSVRAVKFSPSHHGVVAAVSDCNLLFFGSDTGVETYNIKAHDRMVNGLDFSRNGKFVVTGSEDKTVKLWKVC